MCVPNSDLYRCLMCVFRVWFWIQEAYLEAIFYPGKFTSSAISRTLELYGVSEVETEQLPTLTTIKVEAEVRIICVCCFLYRT